jgi:hypothetical protein
MKRLVAAALAGAIGIAAVAGIAIAQQSQPAGKLTLYNGENFTGESRVLTTHSPDLNAQQFNDEAASLVAVGRWRVCFDAGYQGECREVEGRLPQLGDFAHSISAVRYLGPSRSGDIGDAEVQAGPRDLILFSGPNYTGRQIILNRSTSSLGQQSFENTAQSAKTSGTWKLCADNGYSGQCMTISADTPNLGGLNRKVSSALQGAPPPASGMEAGWDRPGSDMMQKAFGQQGPEKCKQWCDRTKGCKAWTWVKPGVQGDGAMCYLKNTVPDRVKDDCCTSGVAGQGEVTYVPEYGKDRMGSDYHSAELGQRGWETCKSMCDRDGRCKAWTWVKPGVQGDGAMCYLKDPAPSPSASDCCVSGLPQRQSPRAALEGQAPRNTVPEPARRVGQTARDAAESRVNGEVGRRVDEAVGGIFD